MFTRTPRGRRGTPPAPAMVYRNPSATISVWPWGDTWRLVVGQPTGLELVFPFNAAGPALEAADWLAYRDLTGLLRDGMTWTDLVEAVKDSDPRDAAQNAVSALGGPGGMAHWERVSGRHGDAVKQRRRALEDGPRSDTGQARLAAERRAAREFHANITANAVKQWMARPLTDRVTEDDAPALAEMFARMLIGDAQLREDTFELLAFVDRQEAVDGYLGGELGHPFSGTNPTHDAVGL